jgi:hypothetical protein
MLLRLVHSEHGRFGSIRHYQARSRFGVNRCPRAANRASVRAWSARNPMAPRARRLLRQVVKSGKVEVADRCQARGCTNTERLQGHHHEYSRPLAVTWLCPRHHRRAHWSGVLCLKDGVPRRRASVPKLN